MDLQDEVRVNDIYEKLTGIVNQISDLDVFPSLVWVWTWDVVMDKYKNYQEAGAYDEDHVIDPKLSLKDIFTMFWEDADKNGFSLEYGTEDLDEAVLDWMIDRDILIMIEDIEEDEDADE